MTDVYTPAYVIPDPRQLRRMRASELPPFNEAPRDESKGLKGPEQVVNELMHLMHAVDYMTDDTLENMMVDYIRNVKGKYRHPVNRDEVQPIPDAMLDDFATRIYCEAKDREQQDVLAWEFVKWMGYTSVVTGGVLVSGGGRMMMKYLGDIKKKANEQYKFRLDEIDMINIFNMGATGLLGAGHQIVRAIPTYSEDERKRIAEMNGFQYLNHLVHEAPTVARNVLDDVMENKPTRYFWGGWFGLTGAATAIGHIARGKGPVKESALVAGSIVQSVGTQVREARKELKSDITKALGNTTDFLSSAAKKLGIPVSPERIEGIVGKAGSVYLTDDAAEATADKAVDDATNAAFGRMNLSKDATLTHTSVMSLEVPGSAVGELHGQERDFAGACIAYANEGDRSAFWEITSGFWRILQGGAHIISPYRALARKSFIYTDMRRADAKMDWGKYVDLKLLGPMEAPHE